MLKVSFLPCWAPLWGTNMFVLVFCEVLACAVCQLVRHIMHTLSMLSAPYTQLCYAPRYLTHILPNKREHALSECPREPCLQTLEYTPGGGNVAGWGGLSGWQIIPLRYSTRPRGRTGLTLSVVSRLILDPVEPLCSYGGNAYLQWLIFVT